MPGNPLSDLPAVIGQLNNLTNLTGKQFDDESPSFQGPLGQRFSGRVSRTDDSTSRCFVRSDDPAFRAVGDIECRFSEVLNARTLSMGDRVNFFVAPQASAPPARELPSSDEVGVVVGDAVGAASDTPAGYAVVSAGAPAGAAVGATVEVTIAPTATVPPASELSFLSTDQNMMAVGVTLVCEFVTGTVARVEDARGFCFIHQDGTATNSRSIFCHVTSLLNTERVVVGERVQFAVVNSDRGPQATHVTTLGVPMLALEFVMGTVARVEDARGFCFIHQDGTATDSRDVFCHFTSLLNTERVVVGERVQFAVVNGSKGPQATHVTTLGEPRTRRDAFPMYRGVSVRSEGKRGPSRAGRHAGRSESSRSGDGHGGSRGRSGMVLTGHHGKYAHVVNPPVEEHRRDTRGGGDGHSGGGHGGGGAAAGSSVGGSGGDDTAASGHSRMSTHWASTEPLSMQPVHELSSAPTYIPSWRGPVAPTVSVQQDTDRGARDKKQKQQKQQKKKKKMSPPPRLVPPVRADVTCVLERL
jgi:cold shock CspA family protein